MIKIDGSMGEGGGQIVRTALGLSSATGKPFRIENVRKNRSKPGLSHQHLACIKAINKATGSRTTPSKVGLGASSFTFIPGEVRSREMEIDIGTAGSVTLLLQSILPLSFVLERELHFKVMGGTDVPWSPPGDYFEHLFCPLIAHLGISCEISFERRGYFPKGGGIVRGTLHPFSEARATEGVPWETVEGLADEGLRVFLNAGALPGHVMDRMTSKARELAPEARIKAVTGESKSPGAGAVFVSSSREGFFGGSCIGKKGIRAEDVVKMAFKDLSEQKKPTADLDEHLGDQVLPYLPFAPGKKGASFYVPRLTSHLKTNAGVVESFTGTSFDFSKEQECGAVKVTMRR